MSAAIELASPGAPRPLAGDVVYVRVGSARSSLVASVRSWTDTIGSVVLVEGRIPSGASAVLRYLDADGTAWQAQALAGAGDVTRRTVALRLISAWRETATRGAARLPAARRLVRFRADGVAIDMVALDVSDSGCGARGVGEAPESGTTGRLAMVANANDQARYVEVVVARVDPAPDGSGFDVGFSFAPADVAEREIVASWTSRLRRVD